jgi:hypothetical protein
LPKNSKRNAKIDNRLKNTAFFPKNFLEQAFLSAIHFSNNTLSFMSFQHALDIGNGSYCSELRFSFRRREGRMKFENFKVATGSRGLFVF